MKIISGNFGSLGTASFDDNGWIAVFGEKAAAYPPSQIQDAKAWREEETRISVLSVVLGIFITAFLALMFGILGFIGGLLLLLVSSKKNKTRHFVEVTFEDGNAFKAEASRTEMKRFFDFQTA